jgi:hypothetical protein
MSKHSLAHGRVLFFVFDQQERVRPFVVRTIAAQNWRANQSPTKIGPIPKIGVFFFDLEVHGGYSLGNIALPFSKACETGNSAESGREKLPTEDSGPRDGFAGAPHAAWSRIIAQHQTQDGSNSPVFFIGGL